MASPLRPICATCSRFFCVKKNSYTFEEGMLDGDDWAPYKLWSGDLWCCPSCGAEIIVGVGQQPIAEHYQPGYAAAVEHNPPHLRVEG